MKFALLLLFCIQFHRLESSPLIRNEALANNLHKDRPSDAGYELYHKLDEAAQRALDLAEEAKTYAEEAEKLQETKDTELTEKKNAIERSAFLLQNYRSAFRKHFNPEEKYRVKRMVEVKDEDKKDKKKKKAKGRSMDGDEGNDEEHEEEGSNDEGAADENEEDTEKEDGGHEDGEGEGHHKGEYTQDKIENAKKHLLESDDLLQQLQEKFSNILKEFGEDPGLVAKVPTNEDDKPSEGGDDEGDENKEEEGHPEDEKEDENDEDEEDEEAEPETDGDEEENEDDDEKGLRKGKSKGKGKKEKKESKKN